MQVADATHEMASASQQLREFHERLVAFSALRSTRQQLEAIKVSAVQQSLAMHWISHIRGYCMGIQEGLAVPHCQWPLMNLPSVRCCRRVVTAAAWTWRLMRNIVRRV